MKFCLENIASIAIQIKTGKTPPTKVPEYFNGNINWYTPTDLSKEPYLGKSSRTITDKAILENRAVVFDKDTVLISCIGDIGKLGIVAIISSSNQQITGIKLTNKVSPLFFYYWCKRNKKLLENNSRRAIVPILNNEALARIKISYPESYDDQTRIATILTRAEKLIAKRKESIKMLDEFLKSTFLEMFGDPVRNEKGWERIPLLKILLKIESGRSPVCLDRPATPGEWGVLKLGAVTKCVFDPNENKALPDSEKPNPEIEIKAGDVLFSRKNTYELVAACAYVWETPPKLMMSDLIFRFVPRDKNLINSIFLQALLSFSSKRKMVQRLAGGAAGSMPNISKAKLLELRIEVPPPPLQNQFAAIVEKAESLKAKYTQSLNELENLYGSLSQRAFKGELDLSKVPIEKEKQIADLHGEVKETSSMTAEQSASNEPSASKKYSEEELIKIIQSLAGKTFSFDSLMTALEKASFEEPPKYEELKNQIYKMLEGPNPLLSQTLVDIKKESGGVKKEIVLSVNK